MKRLSILLSIFAGGATIWAIASPFTAARSDDSQVSPIYGVAIPPGYRDWKMIAVDQLMTGKLDQLRAQLGNEIAFKAFKEGTRPFPDGAIIAALHWNRVLSEDNNKVLAGPFPGAQSFVVGSPVNVQFMVKDSKKVRGDRRLGLRGLQRRQTWRRGAAPDLLALPPASQRPRLCLHPLRAYAVKTRLGSVREDLIWGKEKLGRH